MGKIIDISPLISSKIAVFPGDVPFSRKVCMDMQEGDHLTLSSMNSTLHLGAHADGPNHYKEDGVGIDQRDLSIYWGHCQIVRVQGREDLRIYPEDLSSEIHSKRVLFRTDSFPDPDHWNDDFHALSAPLIEFLAEQGVVLVGIDTPSIDPSTSKDLPSHMAVARHDLAILEGLVLKDVQEGFYELCALPLKIENADSGPVRAALRTLSD